MVAEDIHPTHSAIDVADFLIACHRVPAHDLTIARLNSLIYLAQGYCMQRLGRPLFTNEIEAWDYGPVVSEIYHVFKPNRKYGSITETEGDFDVHRFSPDEIDLMLDVIARYAELSTDEMIGESRRGPWSDHHEKDILHRTIPKEAIQEYFSSQEELPDAFDDALMRAPRIERRNRQGLLVLPDDWDDRDPGTVWHTWAACRDVPEGGERRPVVCLGRSTCACIASGTASRLHHPGSCMLQDRRRSRWTLRGPPRSGPVRVGIRPHRLRLDTFLPLSMRCRTSPRSSDLCCRCRAPRE